MTVMSPSPPLPRRTTLVATIGPASQSPAVLERLIRAGLDVVRLNMSHGTHDWVREMVPLVRRLSRECDRRVGILMDIQGPAIRTAPIDTSIELVEGQRLTFVGRGDPPDRGAWVGVNYPGLADDVAVGDTILVDNGVIELRAVDRADGHLVCEVLVGGTLGSRRHINLPGVHVRLPALTEKDRGDVAVGIECGVDFIAMSFVRQAADIAELRRILAAHNAPPMIIAKLENQQGIENLDEIVAAADAIMAARGDLGIECPLEDLPFLQQDIVRRCITAGKPVIVATQMLESMIHNPTPTRAEITDVAHAVFSQADAVMLSGETSVGEFPVRCLETMGRLVCRAEREATAGYADAARPDSDRAKLVRAGSRLGESIASSAMIVFTQTGRMARNAAWQRPQHAQIYAFTNNDVLVNQLTLQWGTLPFLMDFSDDLPANVQRATSILKESGYVREGQSIVLITEIRDGNELVNTIQMRHVP